MVRLKVLRLMVLISASQSTRAGLRTGVEDRGVLTTSSLASSDVDGHSVEAWLVESRRMRGWF